MQLSRLDLLVIAIGIIPQRRLIRFQHPNFPARLMNQQLIYAFDTRLYITHHFSAEQALNTPLETPYPRTNYLLRKGVLASAKATNLHDG